VKLPTMERRNEGNLEIQECLRRAAESYVVNRLGIWVGTPMNMPNIVNAAREAMAEFKSMTRDSGYRTNLWEVSVDFGAVDPYSIAVRVYMPGIKTAPKPPLSHRCIADKVLDKEFYRGVVADLESQGNNYRTKDGITYWGFPDGSGLVRTIDLVSQEYKWEVKRPKETDPLKPVGVIPIGTVVGVNGDGSVSVQMGIHTQSKPSKCKAHEILNRPAGAEGFRFREHHAVFNLGGIVSRPNHLRGGIQWDFPDGSMVWIRHRDDVVTSLEAFDPTGRRI
jgi:hypothetical protein